MIDDLANRKLYCDILLDQTFGRLKDDYKNFVSSHTIMLLGSKFILLRDQFRKLKDKAFIRRQHFSGIKRILISFGGADFNNNTVNILNILSKVEFTYEPIVDIALGSSNLYKEQIKKQIEKHKFKINMLDNVYNMAKLMLNADVSIGAGGTTSWERCFMALPTVLLIDAKNQFLIAKILKQLVLSLQLRKK